LFRASLEEGILPDQWRHAKIIPLKKPNKENYSVAKAWRPISLLSTLGKVLEAVVAERISHAVETYGLLPTNHFGARKQRSAEQALMLMQEQIFAAWRGRRILSLVSFDVKGAYNGVCKERLVQRLRARGILEDLLRWIEAFCSNRTATIQVNGQASEMRSLPQAGLPQGSPLSPILFLFFNADLVQQRIDCYGGAIAFVDDFTAWVTGPTAESNRHGIEEIINKALDWEGRSGATFEAEKTAIIHFTRKAHKVRLRTFRDQGTACSPQDPGQGSRNDHGLWPQIQRTHRTGSDQGLKSSHGTTKAQGPYSSDSKTTVYNYGGPSGGLCLKRLDACMQIQKGQPYQPGPEDWSASDRGDVSHGSNERSRSRGIHRQRT
jgi:hypothetical protein